MSWWHSRRWRLKHIAGDAPINVSPSRGSGVKTADKTVISHSLREGMPYEVTRLGGFGPELWVGGSPVSQPRGATVMG